MLLVKAFHIIAMVAWFAGLFYLPRLFVYHADFLEQSNIALFKIMERRLYFAIMWPAAIISSGLGIWLITYNPSYYLKAGWMHAKLSLVLCLWMYHFLCGYYVQLFAKDRINRNALFFRIFNEIPTLLLIAIVILVVLKPF